MKYVYILTLLTLILSCKEQKNTDTGASTSPDAASASLTDQQLRTAGIATGRIEHQPMSQILRLNGKIDVPPQNMISISVPLGGYLKSTHLLPGMHVRKGDVIALIEDLQYIQLQQDYLIAKARLTFLENENKRQSELNSTQASSDKAAQQAAADYKTQLVQVTALAEKLRLAGVSTDLVNEKSIVRSINIYSPIDGYVSKVNVNIGKYVTGTDVLFELINPSDIHLALKVFEKDLEQLYIGQKVSAFTNNNPLKKYDCEVLLIGKDLGPDRSTDVHCHFNKGTKDLVPGTYMNAEVEVKNTDAATLPENAVVRFKNKSYVFVQKSAGRFEMKEVKTGIAGNGWVEVLDAPDLETAAVVTSGAYSLLMSMKNKADE